MKLHAKMSVSKAYTHGWNRFRQQPLFFATVTALIVLTGMLGGSLLESVISGSNLLYANPPSLAALSFAVILLTGILLQFGLKSIALKESEGGFGGYQDLRTPFDQSVRFLIALAIFEITILIIPSAILYVAVMMAGASMAVLNTLMGTLAVSLLMCLAGFLAIMLHFYPYFILDQNLSVKDALLSSADITYGARFDLVLFYAVAFLLNLVGLLILGAGLLVTVPITVLSQAHVYQQLSEGSA